MLYRSNSILAFTPQNASGEEILKQAIFFHKGLRMRVFVMDILKSSALFPFKLQSKKLLKCQREEVDKINNFVNNTLGKDIPKEVVTRIRWGNYVPVLIKESQKGGYEFILIDKSKEQYKGALSQAEIDKFVSKSHCPVLIINKNHPVEEIKKIVIPIDISQTTKKRLYWATFFAKQLKAKIQIISALNIDINETSSLAYKNADKLKNMLEERNVECEVKVLKSHKQQIHKTIIEYIKEEKPELVIIRTHQEFRFTGKRIGKFVSEIIHNCEMPIFTVGGKTHDLTVKLK